MFHSSKYQAGRTILGVIAAIAIICIILIIFICIYKTSNSSIKANEIAKSIAVRAHIYRPEFEKLVHKSNILENIYNQNGPYGATILLHDEQEVANVDQKPGYFAISVDVQDDQKLCDQLLSTDIIKADIVTVNDLEDGECPGKIKYYFKSHKIFKIHKKHKIKKSKILASPNTEIEIFASTQKNKKSENCQKASQCKVTADCVKGACQSCPKNSSRVVQVGQRISNSNCYCQKGYELNSEKTGCVLPIIREQVYYKAEAKNLAKAVPQQGNIQVYTQTRTATTSGNQNPNIVVHTTTQVIPPSDHVPAWLNQEIARMEKEMRHIEDWMNSLPDPFVSLDLPFEPFSNMPIY